MAREIGSGSDAVSVSAGPVLPATDLVSLQRKVGRWAADMQQALKESQTDQDMFDTVQWTADELRVFDGRKQPAIIINRIKPAVNGIVGVIDKGRTDPKAWPRTPNDEDSAELATDTLRYLCDLNRFQSFKSSSLSEKLIWGWTASMTCVDPDTGETRIKRIRPEEFIWDPASREKDLSDASFLGVGKWRYADDLIADGFSEAETQAALNATPEIEGGIPETAEDRPDIWASTDQRRIFEVELYYKRFGDWYRCRFIRGAVLEDGPSPYRDADGRLRCPIEGVRAYVDRRNRPYGIVRDMRDPQRELNMRRAWILHALHSRPFIYDPSAGIADVEAFRVQVARADGAAKIDGSIQGIEFLDVGTKLQGQYELLAESKSEIERMGPNPGVLGRDVQGQSGRAMLVQQQAGLLELAPILGNFDDYILRVYRQMWACAQQYGTPQFFVRVTDDAGAPKFINTREPELDARGQPVLEYVVDPATGQVEIDPRTGQPAVQPAMKNRLAEADVDLVVDSSPDTAVIAEEQFKQLGDVLIALAPLPQAAPAITPLLQQFFAASSFRNKKAFVDALDAEQQADPMQQAAQQLQLAGAKAQLEKTQSETGKNRATALKTALEAAQMERGAQMEDMGVDAASRDREQRAHLAQMRAPGNTAAG